MQIRPFPEFKNNQTFTIPLSDFSCLFASNPFIVGKEPVSLVATGPMIPGAFDIIHWRKLLIRPHPHYSGFYYLN